MSSFQERSRSPVDRAYVDRVPYASILAWFDDAPAAFMVLSQVTAGRLIWLSADRRAIVTQGAFVVQTVGLETNLDATQFPDGEPPTVPLSGVLKRSVDIRSQGYFNLDVTSTFRRLGDETITILQRAHDVTVVEEVASYGRVAKVTNKYYLDRANGLVWKSIQTPIPGQPQLNIEILRPYG